MDSRLRKQISRTSIYKNDWLELFEDVVESPAGQKKYNVAWIRPGVTVLPIDNNGKVYLARERKYAIDQTQITCVMGGINDDETPLEAAHRELREELGIRAGKITPLGSDEILGSRITSTQHLFLAEDISFGKTKFDAGESIEMVTVPSIHEAIEMVMQGDITDAQSCILILKAARFLKV